MDPSPRYDLTVSECKRILDEADPEELLAAGAPQDEHDTMARDFARRLLHGEDPQAMVETYRGWHDDQSFQWLVDELLALRRRVMPPAGPTHTVTASGEVWVGGADQLRAPDGGRTPR